jgi:hypothetical protein
MRKLAVVLFLALYAASAIHGQKTRYGQGPGKPIGPVTKVHIAASRIRASCNGFYDNLTCTDMLFVDVIVAGMRLELRGPAAIEKLNFAVLAPGDYSAGMTKDERNADSSAVGQEYDILLPDGAFWHGVVTGISE